MAVQRFGQGDSSQEEGLENVTGLYPGLFSKLFFRSGDGIYFFERERGLTEKVISQRAFEPFEDRRNSFLLVFVCLPVLYYFRAVKEIPGLSVCLSSVWVKYWSTVYWPQTRKVDVNPRLLCYIFRLYYTLLELLDLPGYLWPFLSWTQMKLKRTVSWLSADSNTDTKNMGDAAAVIWYYCYCCAPSPPPPEDPEREGRREEWPPSRDIGSPMGLSRCRSWPPGRFSCSALLQKLGRKVSNRWGQNRRSGQKDGRIHE